MIDVEFLNDLRCPETHQGLRLAETGTIAKLNGSIASGSLQNRGGRTVKEPFDAALVREDGRCLYPVRQNVPVLLIDESIPLP